MTWTDIVDFILGLVFFQSVGRYIYGHKEQTESDFKGSNDLFSVADRLQTLYGGKAYVGLRIPDPNTALRQSIDLVHVTKKEAVVVSVINASGIVSIDGDGTWVCTGGSKHKTERLHNPILEAKRNVAVLESYLELRGVTLPDGFLSFKIVCINPDFRTIHPDYFPPEVVTYDQWVQLKPAKSSIPDWIKGAFPVKKNMSGLIKGALPVKKNMSGLTKGALPVKKNMSGLTKGALPVKRRISCWIKGALPFKKRICIWIKGALPVKKCISACIKGPLSNYKNEKPQTIQQNLAFVLSTAPMWDRLEVNNNKHLLGEFLEFKGKHDDIMSLRNIKKSKVGRVIIHNASVFGLDHTKLQVLYSQRDYRSEEASEWNEAIVRSSTEVLFQLQETAKVEKIKLSSLIAMSLSS